MKRWMRLAARLYPARWRKRYAGEFEALLEDAELGWADFWDILRGAVKMQLTTWTFGKVAGAGALAGLLIAGYVALRTPSMYFSSGVMKVTPVTSVPSARQINQAEQNVLSRRSVQEMIVAGNLYPEERRTRPMEAVIQDMRNKYVRIAMIPGQDNVFSVAFQYPDPAKAQFVTRQLITKLAESMPHAPGMSAEVLDPASLPDKPFAPNRPAIVGAGVVLGLLAGIVLFGVGRWPKVAGTGLATGIVVLIGSLFVPDRYMSTAVLRADDDQSIRQIVKAVDDPVYLQSVIVSPGLDLYRRERRTQPMPAVVNRMRRDIRVQMLTNPQGSAVAISFAYANEPRGPLNIYGTPGRYKAQAVVRELVNHCFKLALADPSGVKLEVLDPASLPEQSFSPNRAAWVILGLLGGLFLGAAWQIGGRFRTPTLKQA